MNVVPGQPQAPTGVVRRLVVASQWLLMLALLLLALEGTMAVLHATAGWLSGAPLAPRFAVQCLIVYLHFILLGGALMLLELTMPGSPAPRRYGSAALFWALYVPVAVGVADFMQWLIGALHIQPLIALRFGDFQASGVPGLLLNAGLIVLAAALFDFFYYWFHRLQHTWNWLWAFHSVHHANRSLNALGCYHHPLEDMLRVPFFLVPMALVFRIDAPSLVLLSAFVTAWGLFNHADTRFSLAPLRFLLADNHYHRIHHSLDPAHFGSNFAGMFSFWDRLFGTQRLPVAGGEHLPVGLDDQPHPSTVADYVLGPWQRLRRARPAR